MHRRRLLPILVLVCVVLMSPQRVSAMGTAGIDTTWGTGGSVELPSSNFSGKLLRFADGDVGLITSERFSHSPPTIEFVRVASAGRLDTSWGSSGVATIQVGSGIRNVTAVAANDSGAWLFGGRRLPDGAPVAWLARLDATGSVDASFRGGVANVQLAYAQDVAEHGERLYVVGMQRETGLPAVIALARTTGETDATFGTGGIAVIRDAPGIAEELEIDSAGRLVVAYARPTEWGDPFDALVPFGFARLDPSGRADPNFGFAPGSEGPCQVCISTSITDLALDTRGSFVGSTRRARYGGRYGTQFVGSAGGAISVTETGTASPRSVPDVSGASDVIPLVDGRTVVWAGGVAMVYLPDGNPDLSVGNGGIIRLISGTGRSAQPGDIAVVTFDGVESLHRVLVSGSPDASPPKLSLGGSCGRDSRYCEISTVRATVVDARASDDSGRAWVEFVDTSSQRIALVVDGGRMRLGDNRRCVHVRAVDAVGNTSGWKIRCRLKAYSERRLVGRTGWTVTKSAVFQDRHAFVARRNGALLRVPTQLQDGTMRLIVSTCPSCGSIAVRTPRGWSRYSLRTNRVRHRRQLEIHAPILAIRTTSNRPVTIDGFVIDDLGSDIDCEVPGENADSHPSGDCTTW